VNRKRCSPLSPGMACGCDARRRRKHTRCIATGADPEGPTERWSRTSCTMPSPTGGPFRVLDCRDQWIRAEYVTGGGDAMSGHRVAEALGRVLRAAAKPRSITGRPRHGSHVAGAEAWAYRRGRCSSIHPAGPTRGNAFHRVLQRRFARRVSGTCIIPLARRARRKSSLALPTTLRPHSSLGPDPTDLPPTGMELAGRSIAQFLAAASPVVFERQTRSESAYPLCPDGELTPIPNRRTYPPPQMRIRSPPQSPRRLCRDPLVPRPTHRWLTGVQDLDDRQTRAACVLRSSTIFPHVLVGGRSWMSLAMNVSQQALVLHTESPPACETRRRRDHTAEWIIPCHSGG